MSYLRLYQTGYRVDDEPVTVNMDHVERYFALDKGTRLVFGINHVLDVRESMAVLDYALRANAPRSCDGCYVRPPAFARGDESLCGLCYSKMREAGNADADD